VSDENISLSDVFLYLCTGTEKLEKFFQAGSNALHHPSVGAANGIATL
jgi:hypothetical protein